MTTTVTPSATAQSRRRQPADCVWATDQGPSPYLAPQASGTSTWVWELSMFVSSPGGALAAPAALRPSIPSDRCSLWHPSAGVWAATLARFQAVLAVTEGDG